MNIFRSNLCYIYIVLWVAYYMQEMLMITGMIAQAIFTVLMMLSFYAFFRVNIFYKTGLFLKWLNVLLVVVTVYGLALFLSGFALYPDEFNLGTGLQFDYLKRIYTSVLPIYGFYYFSLKGEISEDNLQYVFFVFLIFSIMMYYQNYFVITKEVDKDEITNNMGYRFVPLIPMLMMFKMRDIWKYVFLIIIFAFIVMAMKRGAILVGAVALLLFIKHHLTGRSVKHVFYILTLSAVVLCFLFFFVNNFYETSDYFRSRLNSTIEGDTSHRGWIFLHYFDFFIHRTTNMEFYFGCGADSCYLKFGQYAHNDWLEFAINEGILGVMLYVVYWIFFIREWKFFQGKTNLKQALGDFIIIYFIKSLFSMSFDGMPIAATLCIGFCLANNKNYRNLTIIAKDRFLRKQKFFIE